MRYLRFGLESWYAHSHLGKVLESQLRELRPEGVYALLGNYYLTKITYLACQRLGLPLYIHITDDFVRALYQDIPFSRRMSDASEEWLQRAVNYSMGRAAISPVMAEQFELRYGRPWDWFTTLISAEDYDPSPRLPDGKLRLVFAGNLGLQRWQSLARLAQALRNLPREANLLPVLEIYGSPAQLARHREALFVPGITELKGWVAPHELPNIFHSADVLVHAESFDADVAEYTKLSFSTKLSQYMMARRPILAVGPDHLGSLQMVRKARAGVTIAAEDTTDFAQQLLVALSDPASLSEMGDHGRRWAMQYVDRVDGHRRFRDSIIDSMTRQKAAA
jgi:glycosyltransferase involved in cell wall biosynthesis